MQTQKEPAIIAREALWTYQGESEDAREKDFFVALDKMVASEILRNLRRNERIWVGREMRLTLGSYRIQARLTNIEPLLATSINETTRVVAVYKERAKDEGQDSSAFFSETIRYPDASFGAMFEALVGIDAIKENLFRKLTLLVSPSYLNNWIANSYQNRSPEGLVRILRDRYPLLILEGDVGSGKTALARSIGHQLATHLQMNIVLFVMNAQVRGGGHVGELTQNIARAFTEAERCQEREQIPVLLLIDEADALAQKRGGQQTHHEDDAGVNTLIQRVDRLRGRPMAVIFATNLAQSLDAAIMRRATASYHFDRPSLQQRTELFKRILVGTEITELQIEQLANQTEPRLLPGFGNKPHRYTYSDLSQRILPRAVEDAVYEQQPLSMHQLVNACSVIGPTPELSSSAPAEVAPDRKKLGRRPYFRNI